jgi:hypothetical protein
MVAGMAIRTSLERLERENRFQEWRRRRRYFESLSEEQLETLAVLVFWPGPQPPEPARGTSRMDSLNRKELLRMFEDHERWSAKFASRSDEQKEFFCTHGHWPEEGCDKVNCAKPLSDELQKKSIEAFRSGGGKCHLDRKNPAGLARALNCRNAD